MQRVRAWTARNKPRAVAGGALVLALFLLAGFGVATATDSPAFCRAACHEMRPYAEAWAGGPHADIACVECHVDPGTLSRLAHKVEASKEVVAHFSGEISFPLADVAPIPDERCVRCHEDIEPSEAGFDHDFHAGRGSCQDCHKEAGHQVSAEVLKAAGIFNPRAPAKRQGAEVATVDGGIANVPGHVSESCSRCHDLAKTGCSSCHQAEHEDAGSAEKSASCETCHTPGESFAFAHPETQDCGDCHARPVKHQAGECSSCHPTAASWTFEHPSKKAPCAECHQRPAKHRDGSCRDCHKSTTKWVFSHPGGNAECTKCHTRPAGHDGGRCSQCHRSGTSWAFSHPGSRASCSGCHARPASHRSGSCSSCHRSRTTWAFSHPGSSSSCTACHSRPAGHASGSCISCHRTGASWAFRHPQSRSCASCHRAPSRHYGASCASCHSPSRSWRSAHFSHPRIPGGEHSYRSFACAKCHPSGYASATCAKCHDTASGPREDEDEDDD